MTAAVPWESLPRIQLAALPTPLVRLPRFGAELGAEVWMKRDDVGALGLAGNKVRKIEFLLGAALAKGADTVVTVGAAQSNSATAVAAAAARAGLRCVLVLSGIAPSATGNLLLDELFGADLRFVESDNWSVLDAAARQLADELERTGARTVLWPVGCSTPLGAVALAAAYFEMLAQLDAVGFDPLDLVLASSSGGTIAGLALGRATAGRGPTLRAFGVAPGIYPDIAGQYAALGTSAAELLGLGEVVSVADVEPDWSQVGDGYAIPTPATIEAIHLLARTEGIVCDPVYTGKALAGLVALARAGALREGVVFWHTGGSVAVLDPRHGILSRC